MFVNVIMLSFIVTNRLVIKNLNINLAINSAEQHLCLKGMIFTSNRPGGATVAHLESERALV